MADNKNRFKDTIGGYYFNTITLFTNPDLGSLENKNRNPSKELLIRDDGPSLISDTIDSTIHLGDNDRLVNDPLDLALPVQLAQDLNIRVLSIPEKIKMLLEQCENNKQESLDLTGCGLTEIPEKVFEFGHLKVLKLGRPMKMMHGGFDSFYEEYIYGAVMPGDQESANILRSESVQNRIENLSPHIARLPNLQELYIDNNRLVGLPEELVELKKLRVISLTNNRFSDFPEVLFRIKSLVKIDLSNYDDRTVRLRTGLEVVLNTNNLSYLPDNSLEGSVDNNCISTISSKILQLEQLETLKVEGNPVTEPPLEIVKEGVKRISYYYKELQRAGSDYLYEIKLLFVGEGRVGKTSLAKTMSIKNYKLQDESSTEGIEIQTWKIRKTETELERDIRVNLWDFGGQEIYHSTHQFFLTKRSLYLLVTESRKEDRHEDFYYWLNVIQLLGGQSPVLIVLNKCDLPTKEIPVTEYQRIFGNIIQLVRVSCHPDYAQTITTLKKSIKNIITDPSYFQHIGAPIPEQWVKIRRALDRLKNKGKKYISYAEYVRICKRYDLEDLEGINHITGFFHDIGVLLHFADNLILKRVIFLNFDWVTNSVYSILDDEDIIERKGVFSMSDLEKIWDEEEKIQQAPELLELMKKFELCFEPIEGGFIAPQLLSVEKPLFIMTVLETWADDVLRFEFRYNFMPKGILTRLIVKLHDYVNLGNTWRHGIYIEYDENTHAIVEEKYIDSNKRIIIIVNGDEQKNLLQIIRTQVLEIHKDFHGLEFEEYIPCCCSECLRDSDPHLFKHSVILKYINQHETTIKCDKSIENVYIHQLIRGVVTVNKKSTEDFALFEQSQKAKILSNIQVKYSTKIKQIKSELEPMKKRKIKLDHIARNRSTNKTRLLIVAVDLTILVAWAVFISIYGWDRAEPITFIMGPVFALVNSTYFALYKTRYSKEAYITKRFEKEKLELYEYYGFNEKSYQNLEIERQKAISDLKAEMDALS